MNTMYVPQLSQLFGGQPISSHAIAELPAASVPHVSGLRYESVRQLLGGPPLHIHVLFDFMSHTPPRTSSTVFLMNYRRTCSYYIHAQKIKAMKISPIVKTRLYRVIKPFKYLNEFIFLSSQ